MCDVCLHAASKEQKAFKMNEDAHIPRPIYKIGQVVCHSTCRKDGVRLYGAVESIYVFNKTSAEKLLEVIDERQLKEILLRRIKNEVDGGYLYVISVTKYVDKSSKKLTQNSGVWICLESDLLPGLTELGKVMQ